MTNNVFVLQLLLALFPAALALGQGTITFIYTFMQDTSPLGLSGTFQASQLAVASGLLTMDNLQPGFISADKPHYILYQGVQCPISWMSFPVDPTSGEPVLVAGRSLTSIAAIAPYSTTVVEIDDGIAGTLSQIMIYEHSDPIYRYQNSFGQWAVSYSIPEPGAAGLALCGLAALALRHRWSSPTPPRARHDK
jgi:hypothetical protein